jgi:hypothetical protein
MGEDPQWEGSMVLEPLTTDKFEKLGGQLKIFLKKKIA